VLWHDFGVALCLVLVIEGIMPFLLPKTWKESMLKIAEIDDKTMRTYGLGMMLIGTGFLYLIN